MQDALGPKFAWKAVFLPKVKTKISRWRNADSQNLQVEQRSKVECAPDIHG